MRGALTLRILEVLSDIGGDFEDVIVGLSSPYGSSSSEMRKRVEAYRDGKLKFPKTEVARCRKLVVYLKKEGFINYPKNQQTSLKITAKGIKEIFKLRERKLASIPVKKYANVRKGIFIIAFDIPERMRSRRYWIRNQLMELEFKMIQKSVWLGTNGFSEDFLKDLEDLNMADFVEIFSIQKTGTLRHLDLKKKV